MTVMYSPPSAIACGWYPAGKWRLKFLSAALQLQFLTARADPMPVSDVLGCSFRATRSDG
jgi:hypothetical protein